MTKINLTKLRIGPANYAGQADAWAKAVSRELNIVTSSFAYRSKPWRLGRTPAFSFPTDTSLPHPRTMTPFGRRWRRRSISKCTHLLLDGFIPLGTSPGSGMDADLAYLANKGLRHGLIAHGSDVRVPSVHQEWFEESYFNIAPRSWVDVMSAQSARNMETLSHFPEVAVFVSTPDLLLHVPSATWLPLTVSASEYAPKRIDRLPTVLHIPSRRNPPIKGTEAIEPVLRSLEARKMIKVISPSSVSHDEMLKLMATSDIVVDQILTGSYGVTAVEAMASGCVVIGNVAPVVRATMPVEPPIVDASTQTFEHVLTELLSRGDLTTLGQAGREFSRAWHDGRAAAEQIRSWL